MRIIVTGSRKWTDRHTLYSVLDTIAPWAICHGAAVGADLLADDWAVERGVPLVRYPAIWYPDGPDGRLDLWAGKRRNRLMLAEFRPDLVVAFKNGFDWEFRSGGTEDMVKIAMRAGVRHRVVDLHPEGQLTLL